MERRCYIFSGRVQGVGFRATTRRLARDLQVTGWVRNEPDGTVRLEAQGRPSEVERLVAGIQAVLGRNITEISSEPVGLNEVEAGFEVRR